MDQTATSLRAAPPPYIVLITPPTPADPALSRWLYHSYIPVWSFENAIIYKSMVSLR